MSPAQSATANRIGTELLDKGCRQGALIQASAGMLSLTRLEHASIWTPSYDEPANDTLLVVVSQDCDINADPKTEPWVEALVAQWSTDKGEIHAARKGNSSRRFALKETEHRTLIADARRRVHLDKKALLGAEFQPLLETESSRQRFANWLGGRYNRPAIREELVAALQKPLVSAVQALTASKTGGSVLEALGRIDELRFRASDSGPPWEIDLIAMVDPENPPEVDHEVEVGGWLESILLDPPAQANLVSKIRFITRNSGAISVRDYLATTHLQLDHYSPEAS